MRHHALVLGGVTWLAVANAGSARAVEPVDVEASTRDLGAPQLEVREAAVRALEALPFAALPAILRKLSQLRDTPSDPRPALRSAAPRARPDAGDVDRLAGLLHTAPPGADTDFASYHVAITTLVLAHALAELATPESLEGLLRIAADHEGAFAAQIARIAADTGERAVPTLVAARSNPAPAVARAAFAALELMGKERPGEQVQLHDEEALADTLEAFGAARDLDALNVVMSFLNASRPRVREAARASVTSYGDAALGKLREAYANLTGTRASVTTDAGELAAALFLAEDRARLQELYALMDEGLAEQARGEVAAAASTFDKILARDPTFERRQGMVPAYLALGRARETDDTATAGGILRKAARLEPREPEASQIAGELAYLEGRTLAEHGLADRSLFERALALSSEDRKARAALTDLDAADHARRQHLLALGTVVVCLLLAAAIAPLVLPPLAPCRRRPKSKTGDDRVGHRPSR